MVGMPADLSCSNMRPRISQQCPPNPDSTTRSERPAGQAADYRGAGGMKKDKELGASTDAGEVGTLAVSLPGLATGRVSLASPPHPDSTPRSERLAGQAQQTTAVREK